MKRIVLALIGSCLLAITSFTQHVFDPNDPIVNYNPSSPPAIPPMNVMAKWVRTPRVGWNTDRFKSYFFNDMAFRLRFPNGYNPADKTKKYPVIIFMHGGGEIAEVYDNEFHLLWGAQMFEQMINDGKFNAFLLFPQQKTVGWEDTYFSRINNILDTLEQYCNADPDRVIPMGLSIGGNGVLSYSSLFPKRAATGIASSPSWVQLFVDSRQNFIHIPTWVSSGGRDPNPDPENVKKFVDAFAGSGGDIRLSYYPTLGHATWNEHWSEPHLVSYWNNAHKTNPLIFFQKNQFCPDTIINVRIGITPGFYAYEWQKDNSTIATSVNGVNNVIDGRSLESYHGNEIVVKEFGSYQVRIKRTATSDWSVFSPRPAIISQKPNTVTPSIQVTGLSSKVLPAPDGSTVVPLELPAGYTAYEWKNLNTGSIVSTTRTLLATPGEYQAVVKEQLVCNSTPSPVFKVVDAAGNPKPKTVTDLVVTRTSTTAANLSWTPDTDPLTGATGYEVYRSSTAGGPYTLIALTGAGASAYSSTGLNSGAAYFYIVRAVNESGAAASSAEAGIEALDVIAPSAPANLKVVSVQTNAVALDWDDAADNVGVTGYDVYVNNVKRYSTTSSNITADNLSSNTSYTFTVNAIDLAGNTSALSNSVSAKTPEIPDTEAPTVPSNLRAGTITTNAIALDWNDATDNKGVTGYEIYLDGVKTYTSISSDVVANNLQPNTSYSFTVKAVDLAGNASAFSNAVTAKTLEQTTPGDNLPPSTPANLRVLNTGTTTVELDWDNATDNVGVAGYDVYVDGVKKYSSTTSNILANNLASNTSFSFTVKAIDAAGNNSPFSNAVTAKTQALAAPADVIAPSVPSNLKVISVTAATIELDWDNATDNVGVTGYDVYVNGVKKYSSTNSTIVANNLAANTSYSFTVKAIDAAGNTSGSSNTVTGKTAQVSDLTAPTAPSSLKVIYTTRTTVELDWEKSTDNVGVTRYDVYVNGEKKYSTTATDLIATGLTPYETYKFTIKAADLAGNISQPGNQVSAVPLLIGFKYKYYEGAWNSLPDFSKLTPVKTGVTPTIDLNDRRHGVHDNYGFVWEGYIKITTPGVYTFETRSDDGSKFYFNSHYSHGAIALVNNDGIHKEKSVTATVNIREAGVYPIAVTFFERTKGGKIKLYWKGPGIRHEQIPSSAFSDLRSKSSGYVERLLADFNADKVPHNIRFKGRDDDEDDDDDDDDDDDEDDDDKDDDDDDDDKDKEDKDKKNGNINGLRPQNASTLHGYATSRSSASVTFGHAYPSPFSDLLNIDVTTVGEGNKAVVDIYDIYGKKVYSQNFGNLPAGKGRLTIRFNKQLSPGYYMVRLSVNGKASTMFKLMKVNK